MEDAELKDLGERLRRRRKGKRLSIERLASMAHVSTKTVSRLEKAETPDPKAETLQQLADALEIEFEDLAGAQTTIEEMQRDGGPIERIERRLARLDLMLIRLLDPPDPAELERELDAALQRDEKPSASTDASARSRRRRRLKPL